MRKIETRNTYCFRDSAGNSRCLDGLSSYGNVNCPDPTSYPTRSPTTPPPTPKPTPITFAALPNPDLPQLVCCVSPSSPLAAVCDSSGVLPQTINFTAYNGRRSVISFIVFLFFLEFIVRWMAGVPAGGKSFKINPATLVGQPGVSPVVCVLSCSDLHNECIFDAGCKSVRLRQHHGAH